MRKVSSEQDLNGLGPCIQGGESKIFNTGLLSEHWPLHALMKQMVG